MTCMKIKENQGKSGVKSVGGVGVGGSKATSVVSGSTVEG